MAIVINGTSQTPHIESSNSPSELLPVNDDVWIAQSTLLTPTRQVAQELQQAYTTFNKRLFDDSLPECVITLQRTPKSFGYFCGQRFANPEGKRVDEIALNPKYFKSHGDQEAMQTLVHEMGHLAQSHFGKQGRPGYHCREWADRLIKVGLMPSSTGKPGGRQTGYAVADYVIEGGPFDILFKQMRADGFRISWGDSKESGGIKPPTTGEPGIESSDGSNRWKYSCPTCGLNVWGKPNSQVGCWKCMVAMPRASR